MADLNYSNPFALEPNPSVLKPQNSLPTADQGGLALAEAARQSAMAQPFIQMARQAQQMGLAKQAQDFTEYMDPAMIGNRRTVELGKGAESQYKIDTLPKKAEWEKADWDSKIKNLPYLSEAEREEASKRARDARSAPQREFYERMAQAHTAFEKLPPASRPFAWQQFIQQEQQRNPGVQIPPHFQNWSPETAKFLSWNAALHLNTMKHQQDTAIHKMDNASRERVAQIGADATVTAARERANTPEKEPSSRWAIEERLIRQLQAETDPVKKDQLIDRYIQQTEHLDRDDVRKDADLNSRLNLLDKGKDKPGYKPRDTDVERMILNRQAALRRKYGHSGSRGAPVDNSYQGFSATKVNP